MKKYLSLSVSALLLASSLIFGSCQKSAEYSYETVPNDPLKAKIYTLPNGLKIYMTVNKDEPRIQTYIAVRAGAKNDPAETTGQAHYFEHLMFKGTESYGTMNYEAEKPYLDQIEELFETYRHTTDEGERRALYHVIDSVSHEASRYAIPNEYDKLMSAIGASGSNAYTSYDMTVYTEDIPSNQLENWAKIQADRFEHNVIRGFHTELEAVYEEKNMSLSKDVHKAYQSLLSALYPHHPYGLQTVLGTQEQLKNPSIKNLKEFYKTWYVPNNMAICMSGDFDPDEAVQIISQYFGQLTPNDSLPTLQFQPEEPITSPVVADVVGQESEYLWLGWRFPGAASPEMSMLNVITRLLSNGQAGLFDLDLNQPKKVLSSSAFVLDMADYSALILDGNPMPGQDLDNVRTLLLAELGKVRRGEFDEKMLEAVINEYKLEQQKEFEYNSARADRFVTAFINGSSWANEVAALDRMSQITKEEIVDFANRYLTDSNYVCINKHQGVDPNEVKIAKPEITQLYTNRDTASTFLKEIQNSEVQPIEPRFVDFDRDMKILTLQNQIPMLYKQNETNDLFELVYLFEMGSNADRYLPLMAQYLDYLGTDSLSAEEIRSEFYRLGCCIDIRTNRRRAYVVLNGLSENLESAMQLLEHLMSHAQVNNEAYAAMVQANLQSRLNQKSNQNANFQRLVDYAYYGPEILKQTLSNEELLSLDPQTLVDRIHNLFGYQHRILYYGPLSDSAVSSLIASAHHIPEGSLAPVLPNLLFPMTQTTEPRVLIAPYDANNICVSEFFCEGKSYDPELEPIRTLYNEYFGGGMNSVVFQEMRESRGLAYSANAYYVAPYFKEHPYFMSAQITTQVDKMGEALSAFGDILDNMPSSEQSFQVAKEGLLSRLRTERTVRSSVLWAYIAAEDLGSKTDREEEIYQAVQSLTLQDVIRFQQEQVRGRNYHICILGDPKRLDMEVLKGKGEITSLNTEEIFGY
jgi:predicted Zn-dependent peptidase